MHGHQHQHLLQHRPRRGHGNARRRAEEGRAAPLESFPAPYAPCVAREPESPQRRRQHGGARRAAADAVDASSATEQPTARYLLMDERLHPDVWAR